MHTVWYTFCIGITIFSVIRIHAVYFRYIVYIVHY